jgi:hypothetical protein
MSSKDRKQPPVRSRWEARSSSVLRRAMRSESRPSRSLTRHEARPTTVLLGALEERRPVLGHRLVERGGFRPVTQTRALGQSAGMRRVTHAVASARSVPLTLCRHLPACGLLAAGEPPAPPLAKCQRAGSWRRSRPGADSPIPRASTHAQRADEARRAGT